MNVTDFLKGRSKLKDELEGDGIALVSEFVMRSCWWLRMMSEERAELQSISISSTHTNVFARVRLRGKEYRSKIR